MRRGACHSAQRAGGTPEGAAGECGQVRGRKPVGAKGMRMMAQSAGRWGQDHVQDREVIPGLMTRKGVARYARKYGVGSHQYRARVLGVFPAGSSDSLITAQHIALARGRCLPGPIPKGGRLGGDVARFGDDLTVIAYTAEGRAWILGTLTKADSPMVAPRLAEYAKQYDARSVAIDGGGLGSGAVDALVELPRRGEVPSSLQIFDVDFGSGATDKTEHANKRSELHHRLRDWMWTEGAMDPDPDTEEELLAATYKWGRGSAAILEPKEQIKARLGRSPDRADALARPWPGTWGKSGNAGRSNCTGRRRLLLAFARSHTRGRILSACVIPLGKKPKQDNNTLQQKRVPARYLHPSQTATASVFSSEENQVQCRERGTAKAEYCQPQTEGTEPRK